MKTLTQSVIESQEIRYANCWEDAEILLQGLQVKTNSKILSIASGGDNTFSLLTTGPALCVACDFSFTQLCLVELKKIAIKHLSREDNITFLGYEDCLFRQHTYYKIRKHLKKETRQYWDRNLDMIMHGVVHMGKFEKYFQYFHKHIMPTIHDRETVLELFRPKSKSEQELFYRTIWNTPEWQSKFKAFFGRENMGKMGREKAFMNHVRIDIGEYIFTKTERILQSEKFFDNRMLKYALLGTSQWPIPHYLEEDNFYKVQDNIDALHLFRGFISDAIDMYGSFQYMNLSNIFEYMSDTEFAHKSASLSKGLLPDGRMAYWNLMIPRYLENVQADLNYHKSLSKALSLKDQGFFYNCFRINSKSCH